MTQLSLELLEAPVLLCDAAGQVRECTPQAQHLLLRATRAASCFVVPPGLWDALLDAEIGTPIEWRPSGRRLLIGCTRYRHGADYLVLLKEISAEHAVSSGRLHSERLEAIGRLVASIAHELRNSIASIVYSADLLSLDDLPAEERTETVGEIIGASARLQATVAGLLDYAKLGPTVSVPVSLNQVLTRSQGFLRSLYREGAHRLTVSIAPEADWVQGNSLIVEQVFTNLLLNAAQAAGENPVHVRVDATRCDNPDFPARNGEARFIRVCVSDDGPGIPAEAQSSVFEPFFTTRAEGTGLGLTNARDAMRSLGGVLRVEPAERGARFVAYFPKNDCRQHDFRQEAGLD